MVEYAGDFEWRGEGEEAELVLYASGDRAADNALERALPAARLPGVESPVYAAASPEGFGLVAASASHAAPDLVSVPERGLLLAADVMVEDLGMPPAELANLVLRDLAGAGSSLPPLTEARVRRMCDEGAPAAAEDGLIEEEDLPFLDEASGYADALGRQAITAGTRGQEDEVRANVTVVSETLDADGAETLGLEAGMLALVVRIGAGDLGRVGLGGHRDRISGRILAGADFGAREVLPAAPADSEEAADLLVASAAAANFADGRAARALYVIRRSLGDAAGRLGLRAAWRIGGLETPEGLLAHRRGLATVVEGQVLVSGGSVAVGTGNMLGSAPPFGAPEDDGSHPWEEAGILERWAELWPTEGGA